MYNGITSKGSQYLAKCQAEGLPIKLSKVKIGNGTIQDLENPYNFTDVKSIKQEFEISEKSQVEEQLKIKVQIDNTSLEEGYFTKEIGIYADDNGQEILYWYINDGDQASWLPPASVSPVKFKYTFNIQVTTTETVIVNFTGKELWVDREFLNTELVKKLDKGTVPNSLNTAEKIVAALQGNGGLKFDENLLYLNDKGTKKKGVYYLDRLAEGIFECLEQTEETVNNSAKFKNISNKENSDRLDNLSGIKEYNYLYVNRTNNYPQNIGDTIVLSESYSKYHFINIEVVNSGIFREYLIPTQELTQIENLNYKYNINGFILKPSKDGTTLSIVDIPKDGYKKLNIIAGILKK